MDLFLHELFITMPLIILFIIIGVSLFTLGKGADVLVDEAVNLSLKWGIPKVIIGATIISLGTTLPEATVSVLASINGNPDLALGNAIGSVIADTGLIIGIAALLGKLPVTREIIDKQGKIQFLAGVLLAIVALPFLSAGSEGRITQLVGGIFVVLLVLYIVLSIKWSKGSESNDDDEMEIQDTKGIIIFLKIVIGLALVVISSKILINAVEITAYRVGIPESIIAATLVAFGTSLPELTTAITAVRKGHGELAVGNVVGADILNVLFVIGLSALVTPGGLLVPTNFYYLQIPTMIIILGLFRIFSRKTKGEGEITKPEGMILFSLYAIYIILSFALVNISV